MLTRIRQISEAGLSANPPTRVYCFEGRKLDIFAPLPRRISLKMEEIVKYTVPTDWVVLPNTDN